MIDVGVGEDDGVERASGERCGLPVEQAQFFQALEEATVDEDLRALGLEEEAGAGYGTGPAVEADFQNGLLSGPRGPGCSVAEQSTDAAVIGQHCRGLCLEELDLGSGIPGKLHGLRCFGGA